MAGKKSELLVMGRTIPMPIKRFLENLCCDDDGATAVEYGLLAALIAAAVLVSQKALSTTVQSMYTTAFGLITAALGS